MKRLWILFLIPLLMGAAPARTKTYTANSTISSSDVTENENNIFTYLQNGVEVYSDGTIVNDDISGSAAISDSKLATISTASKVNVSALVATSQVTGDLFVATSATGIVKFGAGLSGNILESRGSGSLPAWVEKPATKVKVGSFTRDLTTASGAQAITGVGFTPKAVIIIGAIDGANSMNVGFMDGLTGAGFATDDIDTSHKYNTETAIVIQMRPGSSNYQTAVFTSYGTDGFTVTWTKTNSPTGTATLLYLAIG